MELNSDIVTTPPLDAATVMMLRDAEAGLEVFLLKRHGLSDVLGGAYVFPGGKVDAEDAELDLGLHADQNAQSMLEALQEPAGDQRSAAGLFVAALREVYEESGVLFIDGPVPAQAQAKDESFANWLAQQGLRLRTSALQPWSRWVTPQMPSLMRKRFDTRFFAAIVPAGQIARHDDHETTESVWLQPRAALEQYWHGTIELAPPQIMTLAHLSRYATAQQALDAARTRTPGEIRPEPHDENGQRVLCYPGDPQHSVRQRAMPGPTRLYVRNKRFEPEGGLEALFTDTL